MVAAQGTQLGMGWESPARWQSTAPWPVTCPVIKYTTWVPWSALNLKPRQCHMRKKVSQECCNRSCSPQHQNGISVKVRGKSFTCWWTPNNVIIHLAQGTSRCKSPLSDLKQCPKWGFTMTGTYVAPEVCLSVSFLDCLAFETHWKVFISLCIRMKLNAKTSEFFTKQNPCFLASPIIEP